MGFEDLHKENLPAEDMESGLEPVHQKMIEEEATLLKKSRSKAGYLAASVFAGISAMTVDVSAQQKAEEVPSPDEPAVEEQVSEDQINMENITEASQWSIDMVKSLKEGFANIETADDAKFFLTDINRMAEEYQKRSILGKEPYTPEDLLMLERNMLEAKELLTQLNYKARVDGSSLTLSLIEIRLKHIRGHRDYPGQKSRVDRMQRILRYYR